MRNKIIIIPFLGMFFLLVACKRDKLEGDAARLIGTWRWENTVVVDNDSGNYVAVDTLYASDFPDEYTITFEEKGVMTWGKNGKRVLRDGIEVSSAICSNNENGQAMYCGYNLDDGQYHFSIDAYEPVTLFNGNTLGGKWFPEWSVEIGQRYHNKFVKVE